MPPELYTIMALGFLATGAMVAFTDLVWRKVHDLEYIPAILGVAWFYHYFFSFEFYLGVLIFPVAAVLIFWGANKLKKQKAGQADLIALGLVCLWSALGVLSVTGALLIGLMGGDWRIRDRKFGFRIFQHGIPFAGLIGAASSVVTLAFLA